MSRTDRPRGGSVHAAVHPRAVASWRRVVVAVLVLLLVFAAPAYAQDPPAPDPSPAPDGAHCATPLDPATPMEVIFGTAFVVAFCSAAVIDAYSIWIDGEPITLSGALTKSATPAANGMFEYFTPPISKALSVGKHWVSAVLAGRTALQTGELVQTDFSAPNMPVPLIVTPAPPGNCGDSVVLAVGDWTRSAIPEQSVRVTYSLTQSRQPIVRIVVKLDGQVVHTVAGDDLRSQAGTYFLAPAIIGDYKVTVSAIGVDGCEVGENAPMTLTVHQ